MLICHHCKFQHDRQLDAYGPSQKGWAGFQTGYQANHPIDLSDEGEAAPKTVLPHLHPKKEMDC